MTSIRLSVSLASLCLAACVAKDEPEFCRDHALFHAEHAATTVDASVTMAVDGSIVSEFRLPVGTFGVEPTMHVLQDADNVFSLQTAAECAAANVTLESSQESIIATYVSDCGAGNRLEQIDVLLFDSLVILDEVEVTVVTPATRKHFAIHRKCDSALFRFE